MEKGSAWNRVLEFWDFIVIQLKWQEGGHPFHESVNSVCIATVDCWCVFSVIFGSLPSPSFFGYNGSFIALFDGWHGIPRCPVWWWRSCHWHHAMYSRICVHISVATILTQSPSPARTKFHLIAVIFIRVAFCFSPFAFSYIPISSATIATS